VKRQQAFLSDWEELDDKDLPTFSAAGWDVVNDLIHRLCNIVFDARFITESPRYEND